MNKKTTAPVGADRPEPPLTARWLVAVRAANGTRRYLLIRDNGWTSTAHEHEALLMSREEAEKVAQDPNLAFTWSDMQAELPHDALLTAHAHERAAREQAERERDDLARDLAEHRVAVARAELLRAVLREALALTADAPDDVITRDARQTLDALRQAQAERDAARERGLAECPHCSTVKPATDDARHG
jgi:hypothetical protein